jgi:two-component system, OmpR family, sensor histidine kinase SenX3
MMHLRFGFRSLIAICGALALLLGVLAFVQYRWSKRVAAADAQREREHLETSAALFATQFNRVAVDTVEFLQNDAQSAVKSGKRLTSVPKVIGELYFLDVSHPAPVVKRLDASGVFVTAPEPKWMSSTQCSTTIVEQPLSLISPVFEIIGNQGDQGRSVRVLRTVRDNLCLIARLNDSLIQHTLFPQLLKDSFGDTTLSEYDFAIVPRDHSNGLLYGHALTPDLTRPFFAISPANFPPAVKGVAGADAATRKNMLFIQRYQVRIGGRGQTPAPFLFGDGIWELEIAHRRVPLAAAFERDRRRDLLLSVAAEALLGAAIVLLVLGAYRMQRVAEQKMQFVAAVSHELRAPVSAISMLSRNQADGLVAGPDKVVQYGELIHQQSRRLSEMVEQTLQYAGIHSNLGARSRTEVDLKSLVDDAIAARRDDLVEGGFDTDVAVPDALPVIHGDANLLRIAIDNLLSNALKYAGNGRWIGIRAEHTVRERSILIHVEDHGPGIDAEDQERVFEPLCRGQAAIDAQIPGSGIGLSLVRSAAEAHGGAVTLLSEPGRGSTFTLHIPL